MSNSANTTKKGQFDLGFYLLRYLLKHHVLSYLLKKTNSPRSRTFLFANAFPI